MVCWFCCAGTHNNRFTFATEVSSERAPKIAQLVHFFHPFSYLDKGEESTGAATDVEEGRSLGVLVGYGAPYTQDRPPAHGIAHAPHLSRADQELLPFAEGGEGARCALATSIGDATVHAIM